MSRNLVPRFAGVALIAIVSIALMFMIITNSRNLKRLNDEKIYNEKLLSEKLANEKELKRLREDFSKLKSYSNKLEEAITEQKHELIQLGRISHNSQQGWHRDGVEQNELTELTRTNENLLTELNRLRLLNESLTLTNRYLMDSLDEYSSEYDTPK